MADSFSKRLSFWESRSGLGFAAGSGDINLKKLEINAILQSIGDLSPAYVLDAGCGNGHTLASLADLIPDCQFFGFDYSSGMVNASNELIRERGLVDRIKVCQAGLLDDMPVSLKSIHIPDSGFDCVYTERSLINLDSFDQQVHAVQSLWSMVASGGRLVLCEAFMDGLNEINDYRIAAGLQSINPPWHNRYLSLSELDCLIPDFAGVPKIVEFSGTYYFVSRILHAREAFLEGKDPSYDASINKQSLDLLPLPLFGQSKLVVFEKL